MEFPADAARHAAGGSEQACSAKKCTHQRKCISIARLKKQSKRLGLAVALQRCSLCPASRPMSEGEPLLCAHCCCPFCPVHSMLHSTAKSHHIYCSYPLLLFRCVKCAIPSLDPRGNPLVAEATALLKVWHLYVCLSRSNVLCREAACTSISIAERCACICKRALTFLPHALTVNNALT